MQGWTERERDCMYSGGVISGDEQNPSETQNMPKQKYEISPRIPCTLSFHQHRNTFPVSVFSLSPLCCPCQRYSCTALAVTTSTHLSLAPLHSLHLLPFSPPSGSPLCSTSLPPPPSSALTRPMNCAIYHTYTYPWSLAMTRPSSGIWQTSWLSSRQVQGEGRLTDISDKLLLAC